jgi:uncharacterized membrane protein YqgA involved in biofilm formation
VLNVATVLAGSGIGVLLGHRLAARTRSVVTDGLGPGHPARGGAERGAGRGSGPVSRGRLECPGAHRPRGRSGGRHRRPLTILGSLDDGLGRGIDKLALKATLDGFASIAFAASLGWGVAASAVAIVVVQGTLTALAAALGSLLTDPQVLAVTATGGLLLVGVSLRLLQIKQVPVADLLPALLVAPALVGVVMAAR